MATIVALVFAYIFVFGGCYLVAWGINLLMKASASPVDIFTQPLFWGLYSIVGGFCFILTILLWDKIRR